MKKGICEFQTNQASYFAVANSLTSAITLTTTSSGGGYCTTEWTCSEWSACENGAQTRTCNYPINFCAPRTEKPIESVTCVVDEMPVYYGDDTPETEEGFFSLMTGFVVGNLLENPVNIGLGILVLLIIIALLIVITKKRKAYIRKKK
jgi:hypothetical protein